MFNATILLFLCLIIGVTAVPKVTLGETVINGMDGPLGTEFFGNIPYAKAPLDNLRFLPPVLVTTLSGGTFNASSFGPGCPQSLFEPISGTIFSEDCLKLNIFRPAGVKSSSKLPVMAWIYGGGFQVGTSSTYNATQLVAHSVSRGTPIIYVNFNYRLGSLGFPTGLEAQEKGALNLGLKDQIAALSWIQANIEKFGGDKKKVTLFGESAGSVSVTDLYLNSNLEKYIRAAIMESGTMGTTRVLRPSDGQAQWELFVSKFPACTNATANSTLDCLRSVPVDDIVAADSPIGAWFPVIDGRGGLIPDLPSKLIAAGKFSRIPFISGTNLDEGTFFVDPSVNDTVSFKDLIASQLPGISDSNQKAAVVEKILQLYPDIPALGSPFGTGNETFGLSTTYKRAAAFLCDAWFAALRRSWIQAASSYGVKTFGYLFTEPQVGSLFNETQTNSGSLGVYHGSEVLYVYGLPFLGSVDQPPSGFPTLSPMIMDYWISFATSLTPNDGKGTNRTLWKPYIPSQNVLLQLKSDNVTLVPDDFRREQIRFIDLHSRDFGH